MTPEDLTRFAAETGLCLPPEMAVLSSKPPWLEGDIDRLIMLNDDVRVPGTPWIGTEGLPWPDDHVVIGEDGCGNYWSVLRPDKHPPAPGDYASVWFLDHETGKMERQYDSVGAFLLYLEVTFPIEKVEIGEWRVIAGEQKIGPLKFGMTRDEVRTVLAQPFTPFRKTEDSAELTDAFDTLDLHVYYRDGGMEAVELWNAANVILAGVRLGDTTFAEMERMLTDPVQPLVVTPTSVRSVAYGVEFGIETADQRETVGAIKEIIIVAAGYYERADAVLSAMEGKV
jgi:hypothetical protein